MFAKTRNLIVWSVAGAATVAGLGLASCNGSSTSLPVLPVFPAVVPLTAGEVSTILTRAVASIDSPFLHVAVVDRTGEILGVASTASPLIQDEDNIALSLARTTAYFSNSQAPLSSRTVETLGTFHFPPTFSTPFVDSVVPVSTGAGPFPQSVIAPRRTTTGIAGTPQGPLWQINATNRGADIASAATVPATAFNAGFEFRPSRNLNGNTLFPLAPGTSFPSPGITLLPGAVPLFKGGRMVGGVGCYVRDPAVLPPAPNLEAAEFAAIQAASGTGAPGDENFFLAIPSEGAIT